MCGQARVVDHVLAQLAPKYRVTHHDAVEFLRGTIEDVVAHTVAYLDDHPEPVRWAEPEPQEARP